MVSPALNTRQRLSHLRLDLIFRRGRLRFDLVVGFNAAQFKPQ